MRLLLAVTCALLIAGCGKNDQPQVVTEKAQKPTASIESTGTGEKVALRINLKPGRGSYFNRTVTEVEDQNGAKYSSTVSKMENVQIKSIEGGRISTETTFDQVEILIRGDSPLKGMREQLEKSLESVVVKADYDDKGRPLSVEVSGGDDMSQMMSDSMASMGMGFRGIVSLMSRWVSAPNGPQPSTSPNLYATAARPRASKAVSPRSFTRSLSSRSCPKAAYTFTSVTP